MDSPKRWEEMKMKVAVWLKIATLACCNLNKSFPIYTAKVMSTDAASLATYQYHTEDAVWVHCAVGQLADPAILVMHAAEPHLSVCCVSVDQLQPAVILLTGGVQQHVHLLHLRVQLLHAGACCMRRQKSRCSCWTKGLFFFLHYSWWKNFKHLSKKR